MTTATHVHGNPKILVVDDEEAARANLHELLESSGFAPTTAADGQEALDRAAEIDFAVALMDIKMPRMSGIEALPKLHKQHPDTFIIMTTGVGDVDVAMDAVRLGAHDYLVKPLDFDTVIGRTENALTQRELRIRERQFPRQVAGLTPREVEVLELMASGAINKQIAAQLFIEESTVKTHILHILGRLGVHGRTEAAMEAARRGIIRP